VFGVLTPPLLPLSSAPSGPDEAYFFDRCLIYSRASQSVLRASLPYLGWSRGRRVYDGIPAFLASPERSGEDFPRTRRAQLGSVLQFDISFIHAGGWFHLRFIRRGFGPGATTCSSPLQFTAVFIARRRALQSAIPLQ